MPGPLLVVALFALIVAVFGWQAGALILLAALLFEGGYALGRRERVRQAAESKRFAEFYTRNYRVTSTAGRPR